MLLAMVSTMTDNSITSASHGATRTEIINSTKTAFLLPVVQTFKKETLFITEVLRSSDKIKTQLAEISTQTRPLLAHCLE